MNRPKFFSNPLRSLLIGAVLGLSGLNAAAQIKEALVLQPANQAEIAIFLSEHPTFSFSGPKVTVESADSRFELTIADIRYIGVENRDATSVQDQASAALHFDFSDGHTLRAYGLNPASALTAVAVDGQTVATSTANAEGYAELNLANVAPGSVTVINYNNNQTIKYIKK